MLLPEAQRGCRRQAAGGQHTSCGYFTSWSYSRAHSSEKSCSAMQLMFSDVTWASNISASSRL
jgi:hypothetical protein